MVKGIFDGDFEFRQLLSKENVVFNNFPEVDELIGPLTVDFALPILVKFRNVQELIVNAASI